MTLWGEAGAYVHDVYDQCRARLYPELPTTLPIVIGLVAYGHCLGLTRGGWEHGPRITIFSSLFKAGRLRVQDTMIHEMLHAALMVAGRDPGHGSEDWYAAVRRLSPAVLGTELDARRGAARKSVRVSNPSYEPGNDEPRTLVRKVRNPDSTVHGDVARWPSAFRPDGYDWGEPICCPSY
ncbi:MAG: hypothetical protein GEV12_08620 [Micromonosporaceae bacterium]|nr:hypothetical protein [Micromonosporaceae bacterium]